MHVLFNPKISMPCSRWKIIFFLHMWYIHTAFICKKLGWILTFHVSTQIIFNIWWWVQYPWAVAKDFPLYCKWVDIMFQSQEILELSCFLFTAVRYPLRNTSIKEYQDCKSKSKWPYMPLVIHKLVNKPNKWIWGKKMI